MPILLLAALLFSGPERHLVYQHGRIVQDQQSRRPEHPQHGHYELDAITEAFRERGFVVKADVRPKEVSVDDAANALVADVRKLLSDGVPAHRIIVVGASMGAAITMRAAARLANPDVRFALLGPCFSRNAAAIFEEEKRYPAGRILVIREESDVPSSTCPDGAGAPRDGLRVRELVLDTKLGHGFLYKPLPEWVGPVSDWAEQP